jgi:hypothetical protein
MQEQKERPSPEQILSHKDELIAHWKTLPPEHQATVALTLVEEVINGDWGTWLREALTLAAFPPTEAPTHELLVRFWVTRNDLRAAQVSEAELAQLTDDDLAILGRTMRDHFIFDVFHQELGYVTEVYLNGKRYTASTDENKEFDH